MDANRVINGRWGEIWLDSEKIGEAYGIQAKIDFKKENVPMCGKMSSGTKVTGWEGKGSLKLNKVNSRMALKLKQMAKEGKTLSFTLISKLADPDAYGSERIALTGVVFDDLTLADWEAEKNGQTECPFTFSDYDLMDSITPV